MLIKKSYSVVPCKNVHTLKTFPHFVRELNVFCCSYMSYINKKSNIIVMEEK